MCKKLLSLLLICLLMLPCFPALAENGETLTRKDCRYTLNSDRNATITKYKGKAENLTVPAELDGHPVTAIGDEAFSNCDSLTSISLPNGITSIGSYAFYGCNSLNSISLPDSLTSIGDRAFYYCTSLDSVYLPNSLTSIGANPFMYCPQLTEITVSPDHPTLTTIDGVLFEKTSNTLVCYPCALRNMSYAIPQGTHVIGDGAFYFCKSLTSITLPDSLTSIGYEAFSHCEFLTDLTLPDNVTSIGDLAFVWCASLTNLILSDSVTLIEAYTFWGCPNLTLTVPRNSYAEQYAESAGIPYVHPIGPEILIFPE